MSARRAQLSRASLVQSVGMEGVVEVDAAAHGNEPVNGDSKLTAQENRRRQQLRAVPTVPVQAAGTIGPSESP